MPRNNRLETTEQSMSSDQMFGIAMKLAAMIWIGSLDCSLDDLVEAKRHALNTRDSVGDVNVQKAAKRLINVIDDATKAIETNAVKYLR